MISIHNFLYIKNERSVKKMKKTFKKSLRLFLCMLIILQSFFTQSILNTSALTLTGFTLVPVLDGKTEYLTGEEIPCRLYLDMSDMVNTIDNPTIVITLPANYVSVRASDLDTQISKVIENKDGTISITYELSQLIGGTSLTIPFVITAPNGSTPDGLNIPVTATLYDDQKEKIQDSNKLDLKYKTNYPELTKYIVLDSGGYTPSDNQSVYGGTPNSSDPSKISATGAAPVTFYFYAGNMPNDYGRRTYSSTVISDTLPPGAVFDQTLNPGWTYDPVTRVATYVNNTSRQYSQSLVTRVATLKLLFPNQPYDESITNNSTATFNPSGKPDFESIPTDSDPITFKLHDRPPTPPDPPSPLSISKSYTTDVNRFDRIDSKIKDLDFNLMVRNLSTTDNMENILIVDRNLDTNYNYLKYTSISTPAVAATVFSGTVTIEALNASDVVTVIASKVSLAAVQTYNIPDGTMKVNIKSDAGSYLLPDQRFTFMIKTNFKDPENTHPTSARSLYNYMDVSAKLVGDPKVYNATTFGYYNFYPYNPGTRLTKTRAADKVNVVVGDTIQYTSQMSIYDLIPVDDMDSKQIIDLLPQGFEYVPSSASVTYSTSSNNPCLVSREPTVVPNYKGCGRTALVWDFSKKIEGYYTSPSSYYVFLTLTYSVKVTRQANAGSCVNDIYLVTGDNDRVKPYAGVKDVLDMDGDGDVDELFDHASASTNFIPPQEVISRKHVKGSLDSSYTVYPGQGRVETGSAIDYNIEINNYSIQDVTKLTAIDVLPYIGDKALVANTGGIYVDRGSAFSVELTGAVTVPAGYTAYYTQDLPSGNMSAYAAGANWVLTPADYSKIKGIKIVMNSGTKLLRDASVTFSIPCKAPDSLTLTDGMEIYNSCAYSMNEVDYIEATRIGTRLCKYKISGIVFKDIDKDGIYNDGDDVFKQYTVRLLNSDGCPVTDPEGNEITALTGNDGRYTMPVYTQGYYRVQVVTPQYYILTDFVSTDIDTNGSNVFDGAGVSKAFDGTDVSDLINISPENAEVVVNAGYYAITGSLTISKLAYQNNGSAITDNRSFRFEVTVDGSLYNGKAMLGTQEITIVAGVLDLKHNETAVISGLPLGTPYRVEEKNASDYTVTAQTVQQGEIIEEGNQASFTNTEKPLGQLTIQKVLKDASGNTITAARNFRIVVTGPSYPTGQTMTLTNETPLVLGSLIYGSYRVIEQGADDYDVTISDPVTLSIGSKTGTITVTNKELPLGRLTIRKTLKDASGNNIPETRSFSITVTGPSYPGGERMTLTNATPLVLNNLIYGSYVVTEQGADDYDVVISDPVTLNMGNKTGTITVTNKEKALGQLTIQKVLKDNYGDEIEDIRSFSITVTGPSYPEGESMTLTNETPIVLEELIYGEYSVTEEDADDYDVEISDPVTLNIGSKTGEITVTNTEKALGQLTIEKILRDAFGDELDDIRSFSITVTGPSFPEGESMTLTNETPIVLEELIYGEYSVTEEDADDYDVVISDSVTLNIDSKAGEITVTNTEKALGTLTIQKILNDALGNEIEEIRSFSITVTGPSFPEGEGMTLTNETPIVLDNLIYGEYSVTEEDADDYDVEISDPAALSIESKSGEITVTNTEKALGTLTIEKILKDASGNVIGAADGNFSLRDFFRKLSGDTIEQPRSFNITVTGPSFPDGESMTIENGMSIVLDGLIYGEYSVTEQGADDYDVEISDPVTLSIELKAGEITVTNTEKALGTLTIQKVLKDPSGNIVEKPHDFNITVTGPSFPDGESMTITNGIPIVLDDLIFGEYSVTEQDASDYNVKISDPVTLNIDSKTGEITVTNTEKKQPKDETTTTTTTTTRPNDVVERPKTGVSDSAGYIAVAMVSFMILGVSIIAKKRRRSIGD